MNQSPLISVAMATYNGSQFIAEQLNSILAQTYPNIEIIIVDDCSTDNTTEIITQYALKHPNIQVHKNEQNLGVNKTFGKALSLCNGDYISISDQDDIWFPNKLKVAFDNIENNILIYSNSLLMDINGKCLNQRMAKKNNLVRGSDPRSFIMFNKAAGHTFLFKSELLKEALPIARHCHYDCWIAFVAANTGSIAFLEGPYVMHRRHNNNVTSTMLNSSNEEAFSLLKKSLNSMLEIKNLRYRNYFKELENILDTKNLRWKTFRFILFQIKYCNIIYIGNYISKLNKARKLNIPHSPK